MSEETPAANTTTAETKPSGLPAAPFGDVFRKFLNPLKYFTEVNGRARRGEYWAAALMVLLPVILLGIVAGSVAIAMRSVVLYAILTLPIAVLGLFMVPVTIRRWHDLSATGWLVVITMAVTGFPCSAIPVLGSILGFIASVTCLVFFCIPGRKGDNDYGADPCDPAAVDPASARQEPWQPLIWVSVGLTALNWIWGVYNTKVAIDAINSFSSLQSLFSM